MRGNESSRCCRVVIQKKQNIVSKMCLQLEYTDIWEGDLRGQLPLCLFTREAGEVKMPLKTI